MEIILNYVLQWEFSRSSVAATAMCEQGRCSFNRIILCSLFSNRFFLLPCVCLIPFYFRCLWHHWNEMVAILTPITCKSGVGKCFNHHFPLIYFLFIVFPFETFPLARCAVWTNGANGNGSVIFTLLYWFNRSKQIKLILTRQMIWLGNDGDEHHRRLKIIWTTKNWISRHLVRQGSDREGVLF